MSVLAKILTLKPTQFWLRTPSKHRLYKRNGGSWVWILAQEQMLMFHKAPKRAWRAVVERSVKMEKNYESIWNQSCPFQCFSQFSRIHIHRTFGNQWCFKHFYQTCLTRLELFHRQLAEKVGGAQQPNFARKMMQHSNSKYGRCRNHTKDRTSTLFRKILEIWVYDQLWEDFHMKRKPKSQRLKVPERIRIIIGHRSFVGGLWARPQEEIIQFKHSFE